MSSNLTKSFQHPVRLHDIAVLAKTSVATVSMALAGNTRVSAQTRKRIRDLSKKVGYRPRRAIGTTVRRDAMRQQRLSFGFFALDRVDAPVPAAMLQSLSASAATQDVRLEIATIKPDAGPHEVVDRAVQLGRTVDGLILMGTISLEQLEQIRQAAIPTVMYGYPFDAIDQQSLPVSIITSDWQAMGHRATRVLLDQGHRRIGFVSGHLVRGMWHDRCLDGYIMAHAHAGLTVDRECVFIIPAEKDIHLTDIARAAAAKTIQAMADPPTAYVLINIHSASRFITAMSQVGVDLSPKQVAICGMPRTVGEYELPDYPLVYMDPSRVAEVAMAQLRAKCTDPTSPNAVILVPFAGRNLPQNPPRNPPQIHS